MSETTTRDVAILTVVSCSRGGHWHGDLRTEFESDRWLPTAKMVADERVNRRMNTSEFLDENEIRALAVAARRWPIDPPVGLVGARVLASIETTVATDEKWPNDPPRYSMRIISYRAIQDGDELEKASRS